MRGFLGGLAVGAIAVGLAWWLAAAGDAPPSAPTTAPAATPSPAATPAPAAVPQAQFSPTVSAPRKRAAEAETSAPPADDTPFAPGEAWLRVGEGYVFGETSTRRGDAAKDADLVCLDISGVVRLRCPNGGRMADVPLAAVGMPREVARVAELVSDAPHDLKAEDISLETTSNERAPGVALVKSARGATHKVFTADMGYDASVLLRRAHLRFAEVPSREGGGVISLPTATPAKEAATLRDIRQIVAAGDAIPGDSFANFLDRSEFVRVTPLPAELVVEDGKSLLLDDPLTTSVEIKGNYAALLAARGIAAGGKVKIGTYTGVAVRGDMAGEIDVGCYAYVNVSGNLTGKLKIHSYATVVIDGDLVGEVTVSSYTTLLLRGRLLGKLTIETSNSHFWFQQYMGRGAAEALKGNSNELHLQTSDLAAGTYTDIPGWSKVVVGEDAWKVIAK